MRMFSVRIGDQTRKYISEIRARYHTMSASDIVRNAIASYWRVCTQEPAAPASKPKKSTRRKPKGEVVVEKVGPRSHIVRARRKGDK